MQQLSVAETEQVGGAEGTGCILAIAGMGIGLVFGFAGPADWAFLALSAGSALADCR